MELEDWPGADAGSGSRYLIDRDGDLRGAAFIRNIRIQGYVAVFKVVTEVTSRYPPTPDGQPGAPACHPLNSHPHRNLTAKLGFTSMAVSGHPRHRFSDV